MHDDEWRPLIGPIPDCAGVYEGADAVLEQVTGNYLGFINEDWHPDRGKA